MAAKADIAILKNRMSIVEERLVELEKHILSGLPASDNKNNKRKIDTKPKKAANKKPCVPIMKIRKSPVNQVLVQPTIAGKTYSPVTSLQFTNLLTDRSLVTVGETDLPAIRKKCINVFPNKKFNVHVAVYWPNIGWCIGKVGGTSLLKRKITKKNNTTGTMGWCQYVIDDSIYLSDFSFQK